MVLYICILALLVVIRLFIDHKCVKVTRYDVSSSKIPSSFDGYKIVQLSDLHNRNLTKQIVDKIKSESPDIIVMTGDMVSSNHTDFTNFYQLVDELTGKYPIYFIKGNHEGRMEDVRLYNEIESTLKEKGVNVLDNEKAIIEKDKQFINLYGMWCNQRYYSRANKDRNNYLTKEDITKLLGKCNKNDYNILLMHTPLYAEEYVRWGADLSMSGHIHGGLIRIPFVGGIISPHMEIFPKYCYGMYNIGESKLIVSGRIKSW